MTIQPRIQELSIQTSSDKGVTCSQGIRKHSVRGLSCKDEICPHKLFSLILCFIYNNFLSLLQQELLLQE